MYPLTWRDLSNSLWLSESTEVFRFFCVHFILNHGLTANISVGVCCHSFILNTHFSGIILHVSFLKFFVPQQMCLLNVLCLFFCNYSLCMICNSFTQYKNYAELFVMTVDFQSLDSVSQAKSCGLRSADGLIITLMTAGASFICNNNILSLYIQNLTSSILVSKVLYYIWLTNAFLQ